MARTHLEMLANFLILLYLVTHGVSVPREGQAHLIRCFYFSIRAWLEGQAGRRRDGDSRGHPGLLLSASAYEQASKRPAAPWPPPMHIVTTP
jgi:hypothetical protein